MLIPHSKIDIPVLDNPVSTSESTPKRHSRYPEGTFSCGVKAGKRVSVLESLAIQPGNGLPTFKRFM